MSTRWLVIVVAVVFVVTLVVAVALTGGDGDEPAPAASPTATTSGAPAASASPSASPTAAASPSPTPAASAAPATSFAATGDLVAGWYWLRDDAHENDATWGFATLPPTGDLVFSIEVLATDAVDGARGQQATFYFSWRPTTTTEWAGRLPVTLPNVSATDDPVGYTCRGTVTVPRSTIGDATTLAVRIGRDDVRDELPPSEVHIGVNAASVKLRLP
jgi:hypothetical protein